MNSPINYKGHELRITGDGHRANDVLVYKDGQHVETCGGLDFAKGWVDAQSTGTCEGTVIKGGEPAVCDRPLDSRGSCNRESDHV